MFNLVMDLSYLPLCSQTLRFSFSSAIVHHVSGLALESVDQHLRLPSGEPYNYSGRWIRWSLLTKDRSETREGIRSVSLSSDQTWNASPRAPSSVVKEAWLSMPKRPLYQACVYDFREFSTPTGNKTYERDILQIAKSVRL